MNGIDFAAALPHPPVFVEGIGSKRDHEVVRTSLAAYAQVARQIVETDPELIIIATPHGRLFRDCFFVSSGTDAHGDWRTFGRDPERYEVLFDEEFAEALLDEAESAGITCVAGVDPVLDHGVMVPLHFILAAGLDGTRCRFARISISLLDEQTHYGLGQCVQQAVLARGCRAVFIASGDLSHHLKKEGPYGFTPEGPEFDKAVCEAFASADFARFFSFDSTFREQAGECGLNSFLMMAGVFDGFAVDSHFYSYEGPWGVGYGIASFQRGSKDPSRTFSN